MIGIKIVRFMGHITVILNFLFVGTSLYFGIFSFSTWFCLVSGIILVCVLIYTGE